MNLTDFLRYQAESVKRASMPPVAKHSQTKPISHRRKPHEQSATGIRTSAAHCGDRRPQRGDERATGGFRRERAVHRDGAQPGPKKVFDKDKQRMVNPDGPPMSGSQSRAKGSSIALVGPVEFGTASWRRAVLSLEEHQKAWLLWNYSENIRFEYRWLSPSGHGQSFGNSSARRRWPARRWSA